MYVYIHTYIHTYIQTYTHTYIHTYTDAKKNGNTKTGTISDKMYRSKLTTFKGSNRQFNEDNIRRGRERDHWGDLGVDWWIILGWISKRWDVGTWTGLGWPRIETGGGHL